MRLSEWLMLDESVCFLPCSAYLTFKFSIVILYLPLQTKSMYCMRYASVDLPPNQLASHPAQLEVKRRFESGELLVPCYSLFCVGYSPWLYNDMKEIVAQLESTTAPGSVPRTGAPTPISNGTAAAPLAATGASSQTEVGPVIPSTPSSSKTTPHTTELSVMGISGKKTGSKDADPVRVPSKRVNEESNDTVSNGTNGVAQNQQGPFAKRSRNISGNPSIFPPGGDGIGTVNAEDLSAK